VRFLKPVSLDILMHLLEYVCPKCGFLNPSARSKRLGLQRTPSPPVNVNTDPTASPQPASMEGVESTAPSVDMVPEKAER
jgi:hypothetical protein